MFRSPPQPMWDLTIHSPRCLALISFCNISSPPLANIVLFGLSPFELHLKVVKMCMLGRGFHTFIKNVSFSSPADVGSDNPPPFEAQCHGHACPSHVAHGCMLVTRRNLCLVLLYCFLLPLSCCIISFLFSLPI